MNTDVRQVKISSEDLMSLGVNDVAYIKPVLVEGRQAFAVHAADGTEMAVIEDREVAFVAVRRHNLEPLSVH